MLILSRKIQESLIINGNIEVKVLGIQGSYVKLGVSAPREISVDRQEIFEVKKLAPKAIALSQDNSLSNTSSFSEFNLNHLKQGDNL